jgi:hypothetical protein
MLELLLRASNSLQYREGHEVFSEVTGGRPLFFSRLISGGNPAGSGKRASLPAIASRSGEAGKTPPQISRRKDQAESLGTEEKTL